MSGTALRRVWNHAAVAPHGEDFEVTLDGARIRALGLDGVVVGSAALAEAIAGEWQLAGGEKGGSFELDDLVLTRLAATARSFVRDDRERAITSLLAHVDSDMLCYRAAAPASLVALQRSGWQPVLDWIRETKGAALRSAEGVMPFEQPTSAHAALRRDLEARDDAALAVLLAVAPMLGSLTLGLAFADRAVGAERTVALATLDAAHEAERWGEEAVFAASRARLRRVLDRAENFLEAAMGSRSAGPTVP